MPSRIIREGIISSDRVNSLSFGAEVLYRRLMSVVDDFGRFYGSPLTIRAACWPTCPEKVSDEEVRAWIEECQVGNEPLIIQYQVGVTKYVMINNFNQQQRAKSKFPGPEAGVLVLPVRKPKAPETTCVQSDSNLMAGCEQNDFSIRRRIRDSESNAEIENSSSSSLAEACEIAGIDDDACRQIVASCRKERRDIADAEIAAWIKLKAAQLCQRRNNRNWVGLLITAVPKAIAGHNFEAWREANRSPPVPIFVPRRDLSEIEAADSAWEALDRGAREQYCALVPDAVRDQIAGRVGMGTAAYLTAMDDQGFLVFRERAR